MKNNEDMNNIDKSINSNNNSSLLKDIDIISNSENQFPKHKLLEQNINYNEFLKKKFETNFKKEEYEEENLKLLLSNKELIKRCEDLIEDNKLLNTALNERTSKLNQLIKENISLKLQLKLSEKNKGQKMKFYEEQFQIMKTKNENFEKIMNELNCNKNDKSENNLENDFKNQIKEEIIIIKKNLEEIKVQSKIKNNIYNYLKDRDDDIQEVYNEIKILKEKNKQLFIKFKR